MRLQNNSVALIDELISVELPKDHFAAPIIVKMVAKQPEDRINIKQVVDEIESSSSDRLKVPVAEDTNLGLYIKINCFFSEIISDSDICLY